jgi:uncharacterized protein (TIGR02246 family)
MSSRTHILATFLAVLAAAAGAVGVYRSAAQDKPADKAEPPELAAARKTAGEFVKAFNNGDAKAVAAFWTRDGEFLGPDGEPLRGREAIEKEYAEFFKKHPKARAEIDIETLRLLGRNTALEEGTLKVHLPGEKEPGVSRYSALHIREDDGWKMASVREWVPDPALLVSLKDVEWLIGEWAAKSGDGEATLSCARDENGPYLRCRYSWKRGGKAVLSGTQVIGKDPAGGLRSWQFDSNGATSEWAWSRDGGTWVIESAGTLPDGSEVTAVNLLVPLGKDAYTWQPVEHSAAGSPLPAGPPLKVTRVKGGK